MPALKLTTALYVEEKLDNGLVQNVKDYEETNKINTCLLQLLSAENAKKQIENLKEVVKELRTLCKDSEPCGSAGHLYGRFLVHLFFICTAKNPARRVIISAFQGLPEYAKTAVIGPYIDTSLRQLFQQPIRKLENSNKPIRPEECHDLRHNVDTLSALIENFPLGEGCVRESCLEILAYLGQLEQLFYTAFGSHLSPVQQNEVMHHCLETVKLANRVCQRSAVTMETRLSDPQVMEGFLKAAASFISADIAVLQTDEFLLDCKTTSGMNICLLLKITKACDNILAVLAKTVFQHIDWLLQSHGEGLLPDWLSCLNIDQLSEARLSSSSYLCMCYGILTMVSMETQLQCFGGKCLLLDVLLPEFLILTKRCTDVGSKLLAAKSVCVLTQRVRAHVQKGGLSSCDPAVVQRLHGESADSKTILDYVWTSWEDAVDAIRFTVKDLFENVVSIHTAVSPTDQGDEDPFLCQLTGSILRDVSWSCKGKYGTLAVLVGHVGSARMLAMHAGIAAELLEQLKEQTLACYASDLYESLFQCHQPQKPAGGDSGVDWYRTWVDPVIAVLCSTHKLQKKHVIEYVLPKLLKTGQNTLHYMISTLTANIDRHATHGYNTQALTNTENQLGALVMCLRRARVMGQLRTASVGQDQKSKVKGGQLQAGDPDSGPGDTGRQGGKADRQGAVLWCGVVNVELLQQALICKDEQIRLDGFALLCESQKTSETVSDTELDLVQTFVPQNLNSPNPAFRQVFLSHLKKFLSRMKESGIALKRQVNKNGDAGITLKKYTAFLTCLSRRLFSCLYPGCVFPKRTSCLGALALIMNAYTAETSSTDYDFNFYGVVRQCDITSLLDCLTDTYEDNKQEAAGILISCSCARGAVGVLDESKTLEMTELALRLSRSTRPQDCQTAAYLFRVLLHQPSVFQVLHDQLNRIGTSESTTESDGTPSDKEVLTTVKDDELGRKFVLLWLLLHSLRDQVGVAKTDLILAAANRPLYPTMLCMRYCLMQVDFRNMPPECRPLWQSFFARLISLCLEISAVVSPVVQNSSPEGNVPLDEIPGHGIIADPGDESQARSHSTVMLMPEYLIVCCWRSTKEISLIFGQLTSDLPVAPGNTCLLTLQQILDIGHYFTVQLLESVHRGAFELAYAGFVKLTDMLWRSCIPELHRLPKQWLQEVMLDIRSGSSESKLCATRRSAGVPFYVQALVSTEPVSTGRGCFKVTMQQLLGLALDESVVNADSCSAKVHALNILRALYKDSRLKDDVAPYVADGLKVAILGFKSYLWAVRNSATLLMTAMMTRIFGVKRSRDETSFSRKNCQTGKTFFFKYPALYQFLLAQLSEATENIGNQLHPGLFPVLMVLGRLFPSTMEGTDTSLNLAAFIPLVIKCCCSPVLKTRVMAARALQPLMEKDHVTKVFADLLSLLPCQHGEPVRQNQIHGALLQVKELLGTVPELPQSSRTSLGSVVMEMWSSRQQYLISRTNPCLLTRKEALEVTAQILTVFGHSEAIQTGLESVLHLEVMGESSHLSLYQHSPGLTEFRTAVCDLYFNIMLDRVCDKCGNDYVDNLKRVDEASLAFLKSGSYEVRRTILLKLVTVCQLDDKDIKSSGVMNADEPLTNRPDADGSVTKGGNSVVENLPKSYAHLLQMAEEDGHEDFQSHLFRLLTIHPRTATIMAGDQSGDSLCQKLHIICQKIIANPPISDPVLAAMIDYTGSLLLSVCMYCSDSQSGNQYNSLHQSLIGQFLGMVEDLSKSDSSAEIHMACVHVLQKTCRHVLTGNEDSAIGCHDNRGAIFRATLALLQADDPEVRDAAADIQCILSNNRLHVRAHPYVCIRLFLEEWVGRQSSADVAAASLCRLVFQLEDKQEDYEERLFDRGELNAYRDETDLLQNIDAVIMTILMANLEDPEKDSSQTYTALVSEVNKHITNRNIVRLKFPNLGFVTIFEDTAAFQRCVISVYRLLLLIKYGLLIGYSGCVETCKRVLVELEPCLQTDSLPTVLQDALESVTTAMDQV